MKTSPSLRLRSYAQVTRKVAGDDGVERTITTFVASTDVEDRYSDVIDQDSWRLDAYKRNPVIPIDHFYSVESVVGRGLDLRVEEIDVEGGKRKALLVDVEWDTSSALGAEVAGKVERGFINAVSVGFRSHRMTWRSKLPKDDPRYGVEGSLLEENELYEISVVAVPANPDATAVRSSRDGSASVNIGEIVAETLTRLTLDDELWRKVEGRRLAVKAGVGETEEKGAEGLYWLRG
jgi:HK97 family phage prohead protease